jgi:hypothetical protein
MFEMASSGQSLTYMNPMLSGKKDFNIKKLEVWGFSLFSD